MDYRIRKHQSTKINLSVDFHCGVCMQLDVTTYHTMKSFIFCMPFDVIIVCMWCSFWNSRPNHVIIIILYVCLWYRYTANHGFSIQSTISVTYHNEMFRLKMWRATKNTHTNEMRRIETWITWKKGNNFNNTKWKRKNYTKMDWNYLNWNNNCK